MLRGRVIHEMRPAREHARRRVHLSTNPAVFSHVSRARPQPARTADGITREQLPQHDCASEADGTKVASPWTAVRGLAAWFTLLIGPDTQGEAVAVIDAMLASAHGPGDVRAVPVHVVAGATVIAVTAEEHVLARAAA